MNGKQWSGDSVVTAESPLGPYRTIIEAPNDAILTVTPLHPEPKTVGEKVEIAVGDINSGTCSDESTRPVLVLTLREQ